jgi:uncharacterized protein (TIGR03086 family)
MSEISERYRRLSDTFAAKIAAVPDDRWSSPSPCEDWKARDVVSHVVSTQGMFLGFVGQEMGELPSVDDDPAGAWDAARAPIQTRLDDPAAAGEEFDGMLGRTSFESAVDRFLNVDLVVHGWDLARAAGLDDRIDSEDVARVRKGAEAFGDSMRGPRAFGPAVEPPPGADEQDQLLAFLGRKV